MKELTFLRLENGKNNLIKLKNGLIENFTKNIRIKKADREYYDYEENKFYGLKDIRNVFDDDDDDDDDDDTYKGIKYLFDEGELIEEIIESCKLKEDQEDINKLNEYLEIIFNKTVEITFNELPFKSLINFRYYINFT